MADNKSKRAGGDRQRVAASQGYEVSYFARKHGLTSEQAREIIGRVGNDRKKLNAEAENMATKPVRARGSNRDSAPPTINSNGRTRDRRLVRTSKDKPLARIAVFGGAAAAGVFLWSRRKQIGGQIGKLANDLGRLRQGTEAEGKFAADDTGGAAISVSEASRAGSGGRTQAEIAEEALTLKEIGQTRTIPA